ncbi:hypothetical protein [Rhodothermus marinus]|jgi:hypothetical protein|uniref:Ribbon-helix-helix protein CopG domain-containing protein n=1 Tax=Rhodothermus marinus (strain ATCC 43812 / DSM 4252 / R-10) TaxID=518766 RepID=D0MKC4_RHOM4|nr:hypothetical protein [Rhodothermus marinus]ACY48836.1 hypothetical protein Rmar_1953 [Rhodothermus marinus DSM 4252]BBM70274.1 hypothetical protein RmaAA213_21200 [Rhodothermus marinus]BBM73261.1 hypothetical protein RmaAA338_21260 [Rhodothermus marinus]
MSVEKHFGMRLTPHERRQIERLARLRATTMKEAVLEAVQRRLEELEKEMQPPAPQGRLKDAVHLVGCFEGPEDLSTNPDYLEGYGRS